MGYRVTELYTSVDGRFPHRDPNPAVYSHLTALCEMVKSCKADFGAAFDGDGDRVVFVDDEGKPVISEKALALLAGETDRSKPFSVVYDQKSSQLVRREVERLGGEALMERSGHVFIKETFLQHAAVLAGEISGHYFFGELGYDDGLYALLRMGALLERRGEMLSALADAIPDPIITPDIRCHIPYERQDALLNAVRAAFPEARLNTLDGVRLELPYGWLLVRKSVTEQAVTVRIEADSESYMDAIRERLKRNVPELEL